MKAQLKLVSKDIQDDNTMKVTVQVIAQKGKKKHKFNLDINMTDITLSNDEIITHAKFALDGLLTKLSGKV